MLHRFWILFSILSSALFAQDTEIKTQFEQDTEKTKETEKIKDSKKEEPPKIGNFSLPQSQQPAALFGFGGNILEKGELQPYFFADCLAGNKRVTSDMIPNILYGITDTLSIDFNYPFTPLMQDGRKKSRGLEDFFAQVEYAFYNRSTKTYTDQATILANVTAPSGSVYKKPPTGFGSFTYFLGGTFYRTKVDWLYFTSHGAILTTSNHGTKIGDQFFYQFGIGRNLPSPKGWIYAWMFEIDGQYNLKNRFHRRLDKNSGGNTILATPSIWISSKHFLLQFGVSFPLTQHLFGHQRKINYALNLNCAWSFYSEKP